MEGSIFKLLLSTPIFYFLSSIVKFMKRYRFISRDKNGQRITGLVEAANEKAAAAVVRGRGLVVVKMTDLEANVFSGFYDRIVNRVALHDLVIFSRQLSTMITAGLQITNALNILRLQARQAMADVIASISVDVQGGSSMADALAKHPQVFNRTYVALVRSGEAAGVLDNVMARLAENLEKQEEFTRKVKGALIYPIIIVIGMIFVSAIVLIFVIPALSSIYKEFGADLPLPTRILIFISDTSSRLWYLVLLGVIGLVYALVQYGRTPEGRRQIDSWKLKLPVIGKITKLIILTEFSRTLSLMVGSGISIIEALNIVSEATGNVHYEESLKTVAKQVERGLPMAVIMANDTLYPPIVPQMIGVGEETGKVDEVLAKLSQYFEIE